MSAPIRTLVSSLCVSSARTVTASPARVLFQQHRPYSAPANAPPSSSPTSSSSSSSSHPSPQTTQYSRSQFKVLPFLIIIGIGSGSFILLSKSRTGTQKPKPTA
ncbi:uncharacterized protein BP01DRAFT_104188 [Aspergillus saccharolyticus JOP 1030-1]|uniref:Uncharacterized protein n=1 Tax=Aspergillus saccharolyticus JOP 1030-1 TaxID=1450539 RepID=A0A318ZAE5_9EURO|nr:hypothetical protein BP01DRAFT_104188 [Aspergillus saccharolyticus JOP 1030-1]PYH43427.1 hypothetical protein BP01DRAFT_104188 [Aspergillus saccharolyticus JOP 1030-1]